MLKGLQTLAQPVNHCLSTNVRRYSTRTGLQSSCVHTQRGKKKQHTLLQKATLHTLFFPCATQTIVADMPTMVSNVGVRSLGDQIRPQSIAVTVSVTKMQRCISFVIFGIDVGTTAQRDFRQFFQSVLTGDSKYCIAKFIFDVHRYAFLQQLCDFGSSAMPCRLKDFFDVFGIDIAVAKTICIAAATTATTAGKVSGHSAVGRGIFTRVGGRRGRRRWVRGRWTSSSCWGIGRLNIVFLAIVRCCCCWWWLVVLLLLLLLLWLLLLGWCNPLRVMGKRICIIVRGQSTWSWWTSPSIIGRWRLLRMVRWWLVVVVLGRLGL